MDFTETQKFNRPWHLLLKLFILSVTIFAAFLPLANGESWLIGLIPLLGGLFSLFFLQAMRLETKIDHLGVHYRYFPAHWTTRTISWDEIETIEIVQYKPLLEYGGWGIRYKGFNFKDLLLNVSGNQGIRIHLKNSKTITIGTQDEEEANNCIRKLKIQR